MSRRINTEEVDYYSNYQLSFMSRENCQKGFSKQANVKKRVYLRTIRRSNLQRYLYVVVFFGPKTYYIKKNLHLTNHGRKNPFMTFILFIVYYEIHCIYIYHLLNFFIFANDSFLKKKYSLQNVTI